MINTIFSSLNNAISTLWGYLVRIDNEVPVLKIALGLFLVIQLSRFFIMPMFKGHFVSGSDTVKDTQKKEITYDPNNPWYQLGQKFNKDN